MRTIVRGNALDDELHDEMQFHVERLIDEHVAAGMSPVDARHAALRTLGNRTLLEEHCRDERRFRPLDELRADVRHALRLLRRSPVFTAVAVLSLGLGIGATTAILGLMQGLLWKPLPVRAPEQLRLLSWVSGPESVASSTWATNGAGTVFSFPVFEALQSDISVLQDIFAFKPVGRLTAVIDGRAELLTTHLVSGDFYRGLGVSPIAGRAISIEDDHRGASGVVAVISDAFWTRRFARDPKVLGNVIYVNQVPVTIVGVNPPSFTGLQPGDRPELFVPLTAQPLVLPWRYSAKPSLLDDPEYWWVLVMARLRADLDERRAQAALDITLQGAVAHLMAGGKDRAQPKLFLQPGARGTDDLRSEFGTPVVVLAAFVCLVLLVACANLASLLLARATARQREISLRFALGAGRWRVARQMMTEGVVLALLGGAVGIVLGYCLRDGIPHLLSTSWKSSPLRAEFDARVLLTSFGITVLTGVLFSLAPVWQSARVEAMTALKDGGRTTVGHSKRVTRRSLVVFQIGLSLVLLIGAGLFVRTVGNLRAAELGFQAENLLLFNVDPPRTRYEGNARTAFFLRLEEDIARIPGVRSATMSAEPLAANSSSTTKIAPAGRTVRAGDVDRAWVNDVGERFFDTMGIPMLSGRPFGSQDHAEALPVAVVNEEFVRHFFPDDTNPVGMTFSNASDTFHIVGISGDARYQRVNVPVPPTFYRPVAQAGELGSMTFEVRTTDPAVMGRIRDVVRLADPEVPVFDVRTQEEQIDATFSRERLFATLASSFGFLALVLACIGIYGIMATSVESRANEIGIRMALGAERRRVLMMVLREAFGLTVLGVLGGLVVAVYLARHIESFLFGVKGFDVVTALVAVLLMLTVAMVSAWWPARKASRLDPMRILRQG